MKVKKEKRFLKKELWPNIILFVEIDKSVGFGLLRVCSEVHTKIELKLIQISNNIKTLQEIRLIILHYISIISV